MAISPQDKKDRILSQLETLLCERVKVYETLLKKLDFNVCQERGDRLKEIDNHIVRIRQRLATFH